MKPLSEIKNKQVRSNVFRKRKLEKTSRDVLKKNKRKKLEKENPSLKEERLKNNIPKTIETTKEYQDNIVGEDEEIFADEDTDEFASFFNQGYSPKICITTNIGPSKVGNGFFSYILSFTSLIFKLFLTYLQKNGAA
ncbi:hypothetical protein HMI55_002714 [Coelomomyces lativittatus]|nr:hypothetical protein HMI55_002714 [Coelomomyces lativittatus]